MSCYILSKEMLNMMFEDERITLEEYETYGEQFLWDLMIGEESIYDTSTFDDDIF